MDASSVSRQVEHRCSEKARFAAVVVDTGDWRLAARDTDTPLSTARKWMASIGGIFRLMVVAAPAAGAPPLEGRFLGRDQELATLLHALEEPGAGCVSIYGAAGVGKTRLAVEAARRLRRLPRDTVFVSLRDRGNERAVLQAVAAALGRAEAAECAQDAAAISLALGARERAPLLILDDADLTFGCLPALVERWLHDVPGLELLITSRPVMALHAKESFHLRPLALPTSSSPNSEGPLASAALELLVDRVRAAAPACDLDASLGELAALAISLDGIPAQLAAVAACIAAQGVSQVHRALAEPLRLLECGAEDEDREGGIRASIDRSWQRLSSAEQSLAEACSAFVGEFDVSAAVQVAIRDADDARRGLRALVHAGVALSTPAAGGDRFRLLNATRQFAEERARAKGAASPAWRRHALHYSALSAHWRSNLGRWDAWDQAEILASLPNLRVACERARDGAVPAAVCVPMALANVPIGTHCAPLPQVAELLELVLAAADELAPAVQAQLWVGLGKTLRVQGRLSRAESCFERAAELIGDDSSTGLGAEILTGRGRLYLLRGAKQQARDAADEALREARRREDPVIEIQAAVCRALVFASDGAADDARALLLTARRLADQQHLPCLEAQTLNNLGSAAWLAGDQEQAQQHWRASLALYQQLGGELGVAHASNNLAIHDVARGLMPRAGHAAERAVAVARRFDDPLLEQAAEMTLAAVARELRGPAASSAHLDRALAALEPTELARHKALVLAERSALHAVLDELGEAKEDLLLAETLAATVADSDPQIDIAAAHVALAESRDFGSRLALGDARQALLRAEEICAGLRVLEELPSVVHELRVLGKAMQALGESDATQRLVVHHDTEWFQLPHRKPVELTRYRTLRGILGCLASQRSQSPGTPTSVSQLIEVAWPGEQASASDALKNRLYVAISKLRRLGLKGVLVRTHRGYLLSPDVPFELRSTL